MNETETKRAKYCWIITGDSIDGGRSKGVFGPYNYNSNLRQRLNEGEGRKFRMYDDDGELYFTGLYVGDDYDLFAPLDDYGQPAAGCTSIQYKLDGKWETI